MRPTPLRTILALLGVLAVAGIAWFVLGDPDAADAPAAEGGQRNAAGGGAAPGGGGRPGGGRSRESLVIVREVGEAVTGDRLSAIGDGEAAASVSVEPEGGGVVVEVAIDAGARVAAGDLLARLDDEAEIIARDIAARAVEDAVTARSRQAQLRRSQAGSQADLDVADNALARARLELRDAELALARRAVRAPIGGIAGIVAIERGDRVVAGREIVTIDDRSTLRIDFRVPERFASRMRLGQRVEAASFAAPGRALEGTVTAVGSRVESDSRTLAVQATIPNEDDALRPGMSFEVTVRFAGDTLPTVHPLAIQWDSSGSFVWQVAEGKAARVPVRIVQRDPESVLVAAALVPGDEVVTEGVLSLREGAAVRVAGTPRGGGAEGGGARGGAGDRGGAESGRRGDSAEGGT